MSHNAIASFKPRPMLSFGATDKTWSEAPLTGDENFRLRQLLDTVDVQKVDDEQIGVYFKNPWNQSSSPFMMCLANNDGSAFLNIGDINNRQAALSSIGSLSFRPLSTENLPEVVIANHLPGGMKGKESTLSGIYVVKPTEVILNPQTKLLGFNRFA